MLGNFGLFEGGRVMKRVGHRVGSYSSQVWRRRGSLRGLLLRMCQERIVFGAVVECDNRRFYRVWKCEV